MKKGFTVVLLWISLSALSQHIDSDYIEDIDNLLTTKLGIDNDVESFVYDDGNNGYTVKPNITARTTLAINYRFLAFTIGYTPKFLEGPDADIKGKTSTFRLKGDIFFKRWIQSLEYNRIKGYYVDGFKGDLFPGLEDEILVIPSLRTKTISGVTRYKFNDRYSFKAIRNQNEIQRKSAGSFIPNLAYGFFEIKDDEGLQDLTSFGMALNAAYYYTFVINKKWFAAMGLSPGIGVEFNKNITRIDEKTKVDKHTDLVLNLQTNLGLGYNSKSFFSGIQLSGFIKQRGEDSIIQFANSRGIFQFYVGYRFNPPKFLKESLDWVEEQNPLNKN